MLGRTREGGEREVVGGRAGEVGPLEDVVDPYAAHRDALRVLVGALAVPDDAALAGVQAGGALLRRLLLQLQVAVEEGRERLHPLLVVVRKVQDQRLVLRVRQIVHCSAHARGYIRCWCCCCCCCY